MKIKHCKKVLLVVVVVIYAICLCGCQDVVAVLDMFNVENYAEFSNDGQDSEMVLKEDIMNYQSLYAEYNSTFYRDQLKGDDLYIYNALLYAMEHGYKDFFIYVEDTEMDPFVARECLSLDSPFLEQNYGEEETFYTYSDGSVGFSMDSFNEEEWQLKMEALDKAKEIHKSIPAELTEKIDRMEYLYNYVCENVEYVEYQEGENATYLYDAMCKGQSICDGYSNMLMLLFKLEGVECCEAMGGDVEDESLYTEEELSQMEGHTWVVAEYDGVNYNFDATYDTDTDNDMNEYNCYFGVSDRIIDVKKIDYDEYRPMCIDASRDFLCCDMVVSDFTSGTDAQYVADLTDDAANKGDYSTLIAYEGTVSEETIDNFIEDYINKTRTVMSVTYYYLIADGRTLVLLITKI